MTYSCPTWQFAAGTHLLKLQRQQNMVLRTTDKFLRAHPGSRFSYGFPVLCVYEYFTELYTQQAGTTQSLEDANIRNSGQGEAQHRKYKRLKLGGGRASYRSSCSCNVS
jgi:hypothetical protein